MIYIIKRYTVHEHVILAKNYIQASLLRFWLTVIKNLSEI